MRESLYESNKNRLKASLVQVHSWAWLMLTEPNIMKTLGTATSNVLPTFMSPSFFYRRQTGNRRRRRRRSFDVVAVVVVTVVVGGVVSTSLRTKTLNEEQEPFHRSLLRLKLHGERF